MRVPRDQMATIRRTVSIPLSVGGVEHIARFVTFHGLTDEREHLAIVFRDAEKTRTPTVRIHSECLTGDVFHSFRCDCGPQLRDALALMAKHGGILLYMRHEGRGIGLYSKLDAYALQDQGLDTFEANAALGFAGDLRDFSVSADMLKALGVSAVRLVTNNPDKVDQIQRCGIRIEIVYPRPTQLNPHNRAYLRAKLLKGRQLLSLDRSDESSPRAAAFDHLRRDSVGSRPESVWRVPAVLAQAFSVSGVELRASALSRLLSAVGPLALAVLSGGAFVKFVQHARWSGLSVSFEDAARATTGQVLELATYVQQSNPKVANQVLALLSQDVSTTTTRGKSAPRSRSATAPHEPQSRFLISQQPIRSNT